MSEPAQKCKNNAIFKQNQSKTIFAFKMAYSFSFGLRGNLVFQDFLQKKFYNISFSKQVRFCFFTSFCSSFHLFVFVSPFSFLSLSFLCLNYFVYKRRTNLNSQTVTYVTTEEQFTLAFSTVVPAVGCIFASDIDNKSSMKCLPT